LRVMRVLLHVVRTCGPLRYGQRTGGTPHRSPCVLWTLLPPSRAGAAAPDPGDYGGMPIEESVGARHASPSRCSLQAQTGMNPSHQKRQRPTGGQGMPCPYGGENLFPSCAGENRSVSGTIVPPLVRGEVAREARRRGNPSVSLAADSSPLTRGAKSGPRLHSTNKENQQQSKQKTTPA